VSCVYQEIEYYLTHRERDSIHGVCALFSMSIDRIYVPSIDLRGVQAAAAKRQLKNVWFIAILTLLILVLLVLGIGTSTFCVFFLSVFLLFCYLSVC